MIATHRDLARRLDELEKLDAAHCKILFGAIRQLMAQPETSGRSIGFRIEEAQPACRVRRPGRRARA